MSAPRTFEFVIDGETLFCVAFESEGAREQTLAGAPAPSVPQIEPERPRGRPSYDALLAETVPTLRLDPAQSLAARSRRVLRYLAETRDASEIPSRRTVEAFLAAAPARRKERNKSRRKSVHAKLAATGG